MLSDLLMAPPRPDPQRYYWTAVVTTGLWIGLFHAIRAFVGPRMSACQRNSLAQHIVSLLHASVASAGALSFLLSTEGSALRHEMYGWSAASERTCIVSLGFFVFDVYVAVLFPLPAREREGESETGARGRGWRQPINPATLGHGIACMLVYCAPAPGFLHHMACVMLLYEVSSIPLNIRLLVLDLGAPKGALFHVAQAAFAILFIGVRIGVGYPVSYHWWADMLRLLRSGRAHSAPICYLLLLANIFLNALNLWWSKIIVRKAMRSSEASGKRKVA